MSDLLRSLCGAVAMVAALPAQFANAQTEGCIPLPADFALCAQGSAWSEAEVMEFSGGVALEMDGFWLEITAATEEINAAQPFPSSLDELAELFAAQSRNEGLDAPETLARATFDTAHAQFATLTTRLELPEDEPMVFVTMIAAQKDEARTGAERLVLSLDSEIATSLDGVSPMMRDLADLIRPQEG
jgi:hypothetical protein